MADIQRIQCKNQLKTSSHRRNSVPYKEIGIKEASALHTLRLIARQPWRHCVTSLCLAYWLVSSLKLAARCPVSGCWPSCCFRCRWMFSVASVCQFVCLFVNMMTSERLNIGWWNLAVRCTVQKSRPSSNVKIKGQGHQGQKNEKRLSHPIDSAS